MLIHDVEGVIVVNQHTRAKSRETDAKPFKA